jgi:hypothetical protein
MLSLIGVLREKRNENKIFFRSRYGLSGIF